MLFHGTNGYANAPLCYVIHTFSVLFWYFSLYFWPRCSLYTITIVINWYQIYLNDHFNFCTKRRWVVRCTFRRSYPKSKSLCHSSDGRLRNAITYGVSQPSIFSAKCVGQLWPITALRTLQKRKVFVSVANRNTISGLTGPQPSHYTDWAIAILIYILYII